LRESSPNKATTACFKILSSWQFTIILPSNGESSDRSFDWLINQICCNAAAAAARRSEACERAKIRVEVSCVMIPYCTVSRGCRHFVRTYCLHPQGKYLILTYQTAWCHKTMTTIFTETR
jgi:hypothetical protein